MMKTLTLSAAALALTAVAASAADLPRRGPAVAPAPVVPVVTPIFTWTGFYVGLNAGAAWGGSDNCPSMYQYNPATGAVGAVVTTYTPGCSNSNDAAFTGGVQAGFNWQAGSFVFGIEGDVNYLGDLGGSGYANYAYTFNNATTYYTWTGNDNNGNLLGSLRARAGIAFDRALLYVTGGMAFRNGNHDQAIYAAAAPGGVAAATYLGNSSADNVGWALGAGLEWALTNNMSFKVEYLHSNFGGENHLLTTPTNTYNTVAFFGDRNDTVDVVRAGINWRFGGPAASAPVLARY
jgi:outer membrane immunogenic protein